MFRLRIRAALASCFALVLMAGLAACPAARKLIYPAPAPKTVEVPEGAELLEIPMSNGTIAFALYAPAPEPSAPVIVYFHGNGGQLANSVGLARSVTARGFGFYAVEYPGYGPAAKQGDPTESSLYATADAALVYLRDTLGVAKERVALHGWSLGTGVATEMATRDFGAKLILFAPFTSMVDMAELKAGKRARGLIPDHYDSVAKAPGVEIPVLIVHGTKDRMIPITMGRTLGETFPNAEVMEVAGAGHNPLRGAKNRQRVLDRIEAFVTAGSPPVAPAAPGAIGSTRSTPKPAGQPTLH